MHLPRPLHLPMPHLGTDRNVTPLLLSNSLQTTPHPHPRAANSVRDWFPRGPEGGARGPETLRGRSSPHSLDPCLLLGEPVSRLSHSSLLCLSVLLRSTSPPTPVPVMFCSASWEHGGQSWRKPLPPLPLTLPSLPLCHLPVPPPGSGGRLED